MGKTVLCRECHQRFDREELKEGVDWVMPSKNYYYHKSCYDTWKNKRDSMKNINNEKTNEDYKIDIMFYLEKVLKIKINYSLLTVQLNRYLKEGKTLKGILFSLFYFYEIMNGNKDKSNGGIGIVPYIYEDARNYWALQVEKQENILTNIENQLHNRRERETIVIKKLNKKKKWETHLEEIGESADE